MSRLSFTQFRDATAGAASTARRRPGFTLLEILLVLVVLGIAMGFAVRGLSHLTNASAARGAAADVRAAFAMARALAVRRGERAAVHLDSVSGAVAVHVRGDTLVRRPLWTLYQVRFSTTRDSAAYGATGVGYGSANLRVTIRRGAAAETVVVSRLGRVR